MPASLMELKEGDVLAGKYRVERVLGEGGMGVVVAALHIQLDERVALKFLHPAALSSGEGIARFAREARAAVKIKSEHVARVSDVGTLETGVPYMVMELLQGRDLAALVQECGALPAADTAEYLLQACEALAEAHSLGIVHRDLKPANLFLVRRADGSPCIKVLDFGISKLTTPGSSGADFSMTKTQAIMGSPLYMSPEQMASSRNVDQRTDIWAVGAILYELLTGRVPFEAATLPELCAQILQQPPAPLRSVRPDLPPALEQVVLRCLEKDRTRRYQNVAELAAALAPFAPANGLRSAQRVARILSAAGVSSSGLDLQVPVAPEVKAVTTQTGWGRTLTTSGGKALVTSAVLLIVVAGALAVWLVPKLRATPAAPEPSATQAALPPSAVVTIPPPIPSPAPVVETAPVQVASAATSASAERPAIVNAPRAPAATFARPRARSSPAASAAAAPVSPSPAAPAPAPAPAPVIADPLKGRH